MDVRRAYTLGSIFGRLLKHAEGPDGRTWLLGLEHFLDFFNPRCAPGTVLSESSLSLRSRRLLERVTTAKRMGAPDSILLLQIYDQVTMVDLVGSKCALASFSEIVASFDRMGRPLRRGKGTLPPAFEKVAAIYCRPPA